MSDEPLLDATRALRELSEVNTDTAHFTRAKILRDVQQRQRKRVRRGLLVIPLAALAMGSVAMAATGGYLPAPVQQWVTRVTGRGPKSLRASKPGSDRFERLSVPSVAALTNITPSIRVPAAPSVPASLAPEPAAGVPSNPVAVLASSAKPSDPVSDSSLTEEEFQRYRLAHEAHFVKRDPAAALLAWNEYLAHAPKGRLAVEARYNRALCLLKLGQTQEARRALVPFVAGSYGSYRRQEAGELIATLDADAGP